MTSQFQVSCLWLTRWSKLSARPPRCRPLLLTVKVNGLDPSRSHSTVTPPGAGSWPLWRCLNQICWGFFGSSIISWTSWKMFQPRIPHLFFLTIGYYWTVYEPPDPNWVQETQVDGIPGSRFVLGTVVLQGLAWTASPSSSTTMSVVMHQSLGQSCRFIPILMPSGDYTGGMAPKYSNSSTNPSLPLVAGALLAPDRWGESSADSTWCLGYHLLMTGIPTAPQTGRGSWTEQAIHMCLCILCQTSIVCCFMLFLHYAKNTTNDAYSICSLGMTAPTLPTRCDFRKSFPLWLSWWPSPICRGSHCETACPWTRTAAPAGSGGASPDPWSRCSPPRRPWDWSVPNPLPAALQCWCSWANHEGEPNTTRSNNNNNNKNKNTKISRWYCWCMLMLFVVPALLGVSLFPFLFVREPLLSRRRSSGCSGNKRMHWEQQLWNRTKKISHLPCPFCWLKKGNCLNKNKLTQQLGNHAFADWWFPTEIYESNFTYMIPNCGRKIQVMFETTGQFLGCAF